MILEIGGRVHCAELRCQGCHLRPGPEVDHDVLAGRHRLQRQQRAADVMDRLVVDAHDDIDVSRIETEVLLERQCGLLDASARAVPQRPHQHAGDHEAGQLDDECQPDQPHGRMTGQRRDTPAEVCGGRQQAEACQPASNSVRPSVHSCLHVVPGVVIGPVGLFTRGIGTMRRGLELQALLPGSPLASRVRGNP